MACLPKYEGKVLYDGLAEQMSAYFVSLLNYAILLNVDSIFFRKINLLGVYLNHLYYKWKFYEQNKCQKFKHGNFVLFGRKG